MEGLANTQLEEEYDKQSRLVGIPQENLKPMLKWLKQAKMEDIK